MTTKSKLIHIIRRKFDDDWIKRFDNNYPITGISCIEVSLHSTGTITLAYSGWYKMSYFGDYRLYSVDDRGNNVYHANIEGKDLFISKDILYRNESDPLHNTWRVGFKHNY